MYKGPPRRGGERIKFRARRPPRAGKTAARPCRTKGSGQNRRTPGHRGLHSIKKPQSAARGGAKGAPPHKSGKAAHTVAAGLPQTEEKEREKFIAGLAVGSVMGALLIANSRKTRALLQRGQEELKARVDAYIDERLAAMDKADACGKGACTEN